MRRFCVKVWTQVLVWVDICNMGRDIVKLDFGILDVGSWDISSGFAFLWFRLFNNILLQVFGKAALTFSDPSCSE